MSPRSATHSHDHRSQTRRMKMSTPTPTTSFRAARGRIVAVILAGVLGSSLVGFEVGRAVGASAAAVLSGPAATDPLRTPPTAGRFELTRLEVVHRMNELMKMDRERS